MKSDNKKEAPSLNHKHLANKSLTKTPNIDFYQNKMKITFNRVNLKDIHQKKKNDYKWLEKCHDYIQWLFPTFHKSKFNINSCPLTQNQAIAFQTRRDLGQKIIKSFEIYCGFIGLRIIFTTKKQDKPQSQMKIDIEKLSYVIQNHERLVDALKIHIHNHLRIKRIISCLFSTGFKPIAIWFVKIFTEALNKNKIIKSDEQLCDRLRSQWQDCLGCHEQYKSEINPILQQQYLNVKNVETQNTKDKSLQNKISVQFQKNQNSTTKNQSEQNFNVIKHKQVKTSSDKNEQKLMKSNQYLDLMDKKNQIKQSSMPKRGVSNNKSSTIKQQNKKELQNKIN